MKISIFEILVDSERSPTSNVDDSTELESAKDDDEEEEEHDDDDDNGTAGVLEGGDGARSVTSGENEDLRVDEVEGGDGERDFNYSINCIGIHFHNVTVA